MLHNFSLVVDFLIILVAIYFINCLNFPITNFTCPPLENPSSFFNFRLIWDLTPRNARFPGLRTLTVWEPCFMIYYAYDMTASLRRSFDKFKKSGNQIISLFRSMYLFMTYVLLCGSFHEAASFAEHLHSLIIIKKKGRMARSHMWFFCK